MGEMDEFRSLLLFIDMDILRDELDSMKFYCENRIGGAALEKITRALQLFQELEKRNLLGPDNKTFLADILRHVGRNDLGNKLLGIEEVAIPPQRTVPNAPVVTGNLENFHLSEISEDLGRDWKRLGRKLGLKESVIDNIDNDHRKVKEKSCEVMLRWKRENGVNATGQVLADALTFIGRKDVAERLAGPLEAMADDLRQHLPIQELNNPKKDENVSSAVHETDSPNNTRSLHNGSNALNNDGPNTGAMPTQEESPPVQPLLGILDPSRYFVFNKIGDGSCGMVYLCKTKDGANTYAVKQVLLGMNNKDTQKQVKNLKKEIEILKKLKHPYIVTLFHAEDTKNALSIFMEYLSKGSIYDHVVETGAMNEILVRKYTYQILKGCEYLHQQKVIHMDIKGANVLIDSSDNIRLADFGISSNIEKVKTSTGPTGFRGSVYWSSPEQVDDREKPAFYFDIWSIGCTVVEMLTTKPPNYELSPTQALAKIMRGEVRSPEHLSELAKTFISLCFAVKNERPNATVLLENDFPTEHVPGEQ